MEEEEGEVDMAQTVGTAEMAYQMQALILYVVLAVEEEDGVN